MSRRFLKKSATSFILALFFYAIPFASLALAEGSYDFTEDSGIKNTADIGGYVTDSSVSSVDSIIGNIILTIISLVGVIFLGIVIYGGFTWMTATGNSQKVEQANKIVMGALFGLMITLSAYIISYFLINHFWVKRF